MTRMIALTIALVALGACAPKLQPPGSQFQAPVMLADAVIAHDGYRLPWRSWVARDERAVAIALHGFNDYANSYAESGPFWAAHGLTLYAYDQRGFGATEYRGLWPGLAALTADLKSVARLVAARHPGRPMHLIGTSMGSAVILAAMGEEDAPAVAGLVLAAPAVWGRSTMNWFQRGLLWLSAHTVPWHPLSGQGLHIRPSDNIAMLQALGADPLVIKYTRTDAVWGLVDAMDAGAAAAPRIETATLLLYGARDELIPKRPFERLTSNYGAPYRVAVYPDGWHMLFRDLQREIVWRDVLAWIDDRSAPLPSGFESDGAEIGGALRSAERSKTCESNC